MSCPLGKHLTVTGCQAASCSRRAYCRVIAGALVEQARDAEQLAPASPACPRNGNGPELRRFDLFASAEE
jgi:hypothetical protein